MPRTSLVLLSFTFSSLIRHQRLLIRFDRFLRGFASEAFSLSDPLKDFKLLGRVVAVDEEVLGGESSRGVDVGAIEGERFDDRDCDESDLVDGESRVGVAGRGDPRPVPLGR